MFFTKSRKGRKIRILSHYFKIWWGNPLSLKNQGGRDNPHPFILYQIWWGNLFKKNRGHGNPHLLTLYQNMAGQSAFSKNQGGQGSPHPYKLFQ